MGMYFWDQRDGPNNSGWWLSPKVGSDVVWGYNPNQSAQTPPTSGWKLPYDGEVDRNFTITVRNVAAQQQGAQQQSWGQQQGAQNAGWGQQQQAAPAQQQWGQQQAAQQQAWGQQKA